MPPYILYLYVHTSVGENNLLSGAIAISKKELDLGYDMQLLILPLEITVNEYTNRMYIQFSILKKNWTN